MLSLAPPACGLLARLLAPQLTPAYSGTAALATSARAAAAAAASGGAAAPPTGTGTPAARPPLPPFTEESARQKVQMAEDAWNTL
jgi:hypothetical protein